ARIARSRWRWRRSCPSRWRRAASGSARRPRGPTPAGRSPRAGRRAVYKDYGARRTWTGEGTRAGGTGRAPEAGREVGRPMRSGARARRLTARDGAPRRISLPTPRPAAAQYLRRTVYVSTDSLPAAIGSENWSVLASFFVAGNVLLRTS